MSITETLTKVIDEVLDEREKEVILSVLDSADEIDFDKWFFFGNNCMGFKQWSSINRYQFGTAHPLDNAHTDAVKYMMPTFKKIMETQNV